MTRHVSPRIAIINSTQPSFSNHNFVKIERRNSGKREVGNVMRVVNLLWCHMSAQGCVQEILWQETIENTLCYKLLEWGARCQDARGRKSEVWVTICKSQKKKIWKESRRQYSELLRSHQFAQGGVLDSRVGSWPSVLFKKKAIIYNVETPWCTKKVQTFEIYKIEICKFELTNLNLQVSNLEVWAWKFVL